MDGFKFDDETERIMGVALEMARAALRPADRTGPATEILAKGIIALAREGLLDPNLLCGSPQLVYLTSRNLPSASSADLCRVLVL